MEKQAKYRKHIENLKKLAQSQAKFKQLVQQARRGQVIAAETAATALKPITEALLGKQPETKPITEEEAKKLQEKGLLGLVKEQQEAVVEKIKEQQEAAVEKIKEQQKAAAKKIIERTDKEKRELAEALTRRIDDPDIRRAERKRLIDNPIELKQKLISTVIPVKRFKEYREILDKEQYERGFKHRLANIDSKITDGEYEDFNDKYKEFKKVRLYQVRKDEFKAKEKIAKLKEISDEGKDSLKNIVIENRNYYKDYELYRHGIIADLYTEAINDITIGNWFGVSHLTGLDNIARHYDKVPEGTYYTEIPHTVMIEDQFRYLLESVRKMRENCKYKAIDKIKDDEFLIFIKEYGISDLDVYNWGDARLDEIRNKLRDIVEENKDAYDKIDEVDIDDIEEAYKRARDLVIANTFLKTFKFLEDKKDYPEEFVYRVLHSYDEIRARGDFEEYVRKANEEDRKAEQREAARREAEQEIKSF